MKLHQLLIESYSFLKECNITNYVSDAKVLISHVLANSDFKYLILNLDKDIDINLVRKVKKLIARRAKNEPIAYILGYKYFWENSFFVNKNVLIPRPESELIVELVLKKFDKSKKLRILDLGAGSGCLLLSILRSLPYTTGCAVDISKDALEVVEINRKRLNISKNRIRIIQSDWFSNVEGKFDIVITNPPYVSQEEYKILEPDVRDFEPKIAITDFGDGLSYYRDIVSKIGSHITKKGFFIMEIGYNQRDMIDDILMQNKYKADHYKDLNNIYRVVLVRRHYI